PLANWTNMVKFLGKQGFIVRPCPISDKDSTPVNFVTTDSVWAYSCACRHLRNNQLEKAIQVLEGAQGTDRSDFSEHFRALRGILSALAARQADMKRLAQKVRLSLQDSESSYKAAQMFYRGATASASAPIGVRGRQIGDSTREQQMSVAKSAYDKALKDLRFVCIDFETFTQKVAASNKELCARFPNAYAARLFTESGFLINTYISTFEALQKLCAEIEKSGLLNDLAVSEYYKAKDAVDKCTQEVRTFKKTLGETPEALHTTQQTLCENVRLSADLVSALRVDDQSRENVLLGLRKAGVAFYGDKGNIMARAAAGYFRIHLHAQTFRNTLEGDVAETGHHLEALSREFDDVRKPGLFQAVMKVAGKGDFSVRQGEGSNKTGSVMGLCVSETEAEGLPFPLSVWISPRKHDKVIQDTTVSADSTLITPYFGYWKTWSVAERYIFEVVSKPIEFEDYGAKDIDMCIAALEAYKWLCNSQPTYMDDQALHIAFQSLLAGKGGDSAGVTMATAAYSHIKRLPVSRNVAMTGSLRSDGSVHGVGGVFEKIRGAATAPEIEIVVLPKENEADSMLLPLETLCRVTIVAASDISIYLNYATDASCRQQDLVKLRKAQVLILTGNREQAVPLLLDVAYRCPEIYTARRLLELIAFCKKAESLKVK
ncbi:MAG: S16 family serine protease, partial [bacterium]